MGTHMTSLPIDAEKQINPFLNVDLFNVDDALKALYLKFPLLHQHCIRTARMSALIGQELCLTERELQLLNISALLHDIGQLGMDQSSVEKSRVPFFYGKDYIKQHVLIGFELLKIGNFPESICQTVLHHTEWFNGEGLPSGLSGEKFPFTQESFRWLKFTTP